MLLKDSSSRTSRHSDGQVLPLVLPLRFFLVIFLFFSTVTGHPLATSLSIKTGPSDLNHSTDPSITTDQPQQRDQLGQPDQTASAYAPIDPHQTTGAYAPDAPYQTDAGDSLKGVIRFVFGSDSSTPGIHLYSKTANYANANFDLFRSPARQTFRIMDPAFRDRYRDSSGRPFRFTWWMQGGSLYRYATNTNIPYPSLMSLYLMNKYHKENMERYGDEFTYHYHTWVWSDATGDGIYYWNQTPQYIDSRDDFFLNMAEALIEEDMFTVSFRSGWHFMDNDWQADLDDWIPFSMHNAWPANRTGSPEPVNNIYVWNEAPSDWVPFRPRSDNYMLPGGNRGWNTRSIHFRSVRESTIRQIFEAANQGIDQVPCIWSHVAEATFIEDLERVFELIETVAEEYPDIEYYYDTGIEAMQGWLQTEDTTPPELTVEEMAEGGGYRIRVRSDKPLFMSRPFLAAKNVYEKHRRVEMNQVAPLTWESDEILTHQNAVSWSIAATDSSGNLTRHHRDWLPRVIRVDDESDGFSVTGNWRTADYRELDAAWGAQAHVAEPSSDRATARWTTTIPEAAHYDVQIRFPSGVELPATIPFSVYHNEVEVKSADITNIAYDRWIYLYDLEIEADDQLAVEIRRNEGASPSALTADVVRLTAYRPPFFLVHSDEEPDLGFIQHGDSRNFSLIFENRGYESAVITHVESRNGNIVFDSGDSGTSGVTGSSSDSRDSGSSGVTGSSADFRNSGNSNSSRSYGTTNKSDHTALPVTVTGRSHRELTFRFRADGYGIIRDTLIVYSSGSADHTSGSSAHSSGSAAHAAGSGSHVSGSGKHDNGSGSYNNGSGNHVTGSAAYDSVSGGHDTSSGGIDSNSGSQVFEIPVEAYGKGPFQLVDNEDTGQYEESGSWNYSVAHAHGNSSRWVLISNANRDAFARYHFSIEHSNRYALSYIVPGASNSALRARYEVQRNGEVILERIVDQNIDRAAWRWLGSFDATSSDEIQVTVSMPDTDQPSRVLRADAMQIEQLGGNRDFTIMDNESENYSEKGTWHTSNNQAWGTSSRYTSSPEAQATYLFPDVHPGLVELEVLLPKTENAVTRARYRMYRMEQLLGLSIINQNENSGDWVAAGVFPVDLPGDISIVVDMPENTEMDGVLRADAIRLTYNRGATDTFVPEPEERPETSRLHQNYPNPFNPVTTIRFDLAEDSRHIRLTVYDILGRQVAVLVNETLPAGTHTVSFDAAALASGVYLYRLETGKKNLHRTMMLVK